MYNGWSVTSKSKWLDVPIDTSRRLLAAGDKLSPIKLETGSIPASFRQSSK